MMSKNAGRNTQLKEGGRSAFGCPSFWLRILTADVTHFKPEKWLVRRDIDASSRDVQHPGG